MALLKCGRGLKGHGASCGAIRPASLRVRVLVKVEPGEPDPSSGVGFLQVVPGEFSVHLIDSVLPGPAQRHEVVDARASRFPQAALQFGPGHEIRHVRRL